MCLTWLCFIVQLWPVLFLCACIKIKGWDFISLLSFYHFGIDTNTMCFRGTQNSPNENPGPKKWSQRKCSTWCTASIASRWKFSPILSRQFSHEITCIHPCFNEFLNVQFSCLPLIKLQLTTLSHPPLYPTVAYFYSSSFQFCFLLSSV